MGNQLRDGRARCATLAAVLSLGVVGAWPEPGKDRPTSSGASGKHGPAIEFRSGSALFGPAIAVRVLALGSIAGFSAESIAWVSSAVIWASGFIPVSAFALSVNLSTSDLISSISASRMASMNWLRISAAMRRILAAACPTWSMTRGSSFGPMTINATIPTMISLPASKSNIRKRLSQVFGLTGICGPRPPPRLVPSSPTLQLRNWRTDHSTKLAVWVSGGLMIDGPHRRIARVLALCLFVVVREALFERFDALGDIALDVGYLSLAAKSDQHDGPDNQPMPDRHTAHGATLRILVT